MLKAILDSLDDVEEHFHGLYTERDGKFELTGIEGIKTQADVDRLKSSLEKERNDHKVTKQKYSVLGDRDPEEVVSILDRVPELEAAAKGNIDEDKMNEIVEGRIKTKIAPIERERLQLAKQVDELTGQVQTYAQKETTRKIHDAVREVVGKAEGFQQSAIEDALLYAERMLEIDEEGRVITKNDVGVTPGIEPSVWLTEMQQKKAHWWGPSQGGGAGGNRGGAGGGGSNPWSHEGWNMTEQGKILNENRSRAEQLAKSAGTQIGGPKPAPKK